MHQHRYLGGDDGNADVDEKGDGGDDCKQSNNDKEPKYNFHNTHKGSKKLRRRNSYLYKSTNTECIREKEFLDPFGKKNGTNNQADQ